MIQAGQLAYYAKSRGLYKPLKAAHNFKTAKERVPLLCGDEMYVKSRKTHIRLRSSPHEQSPKKSGS